MKIGILINENTLASAATWIWSAWLEGFTANGCACEIITTRDLYLNSYDLVIIDFALTPIESPDLYDYIVSLARNGTKIASNFFISQEVHLHTRAQFLSRLAEDGHLLFTFGEQEDYAAQFIQDTYPFQYKIFPNPVKPSIIKYSQSLPDANPSFHSDVVFIGARLPLKNWFNSNIIKPLLRSNIRVHLYGLGWKKRHIFAQAFKRIPFVSKNLVNLVHKQLCPTLSEQIEAMLYRYCAVSLNFHERDKFSLNLSHPIVNQRVFKISACGGAQITDQNHLIDRYYPLGSIKQIELDKQAWFSSIEDQINGFQSEHSRSLRRELMSFTAKNYSADVIALQLLHSF